MPIYGHKTQDEVHYVNNIKPVDALVHADASLKMDDSSSIQDEMHLSIWIT
jgi:hypothetical protein